MDDEVPEKLDFHLICRCCLFEPKNGSLKPLFGSAVDSMMKEVTNIEVSQDDGLPQQVCVQCLIQISKAYTLRLQCEKSNNILRSYLEKEKEAQNETIDAEEDPQPTDQEDYSTKLTPDPLIPLDCEEELVPVVFPELLTEKETSEEDLRPETLSISSESSRDVNNEDTENPNDLYGKVFGDIETISTTHDEEIENLMETPATSSSPKTLQAFICKMCSMTYDNQHSLDYHQEKAHPGKNLSNNECDICGNTFVTQKAIRRHMKTHFAKKPHSCPSCDASFSDKSNLTKHLKSHTGELRNAQGPSLVCPDCGKEFKWARSLQKHRKLHTGQNLHKCPVQDCHKVFAEAKGLQLHLDCHYGDKPFVCSLCERRFGDQANLKRHMRIHDGLRPFSCLLCEKTFRQAHHLKYHVNKIHRERSPGGGGEESEIRRTRGSFVGFKRPLKNCLDANSVDHQAMSILRDELLAEMEERTRKEEVEMMDKE